MSTSKATRVRDLHKAWMKDPEYRKEYAALGDEFGIAKTLVKARSAGKARALLKRAANRANRKSPRP